MSAKSVITSSITAFGKLGKEIKISPKSNVSINKPNYKVEYFDETIDVLIGIGKDHTATLIMSKDAWVALNNGDKIHIETQKSFKKLL